MSRWRVVTCVRVRGRRSIPAVGTAAASTSHPSNPNRVVMVCGCGSTKPHPRVAVMRLAGELDTIDSGFVQDHALSVLRSYRHLLVDLSEVTFLGSTRLPAPHVATRVDL